MTRWFAGILLSLTVLLQYRIWLSDDGVSEAYRLKVAVDQQTDTNAELRRRNEQLAAEVADLKSGLTAIEERARSELGMIATGESFSASASPPAAGAPQVEPTVATRTAQR